jgi:hypothetical protein
VVEKAMQDYQEDLKEEFLYAMDCVQRGNFTEALDIAKQHKGCVAGYGW